MQRAMSLPDSHKVKISNMNVSIAVSGKFIRGIDTQEGDTLEMKGPLPKFPYKANMKTKIGMVDLHSSCLPVSMAVHGRL